ncbi:unnamed protein product, partial [Ectocarpus sp. 12 AP-2014]
YTLPSSTRPVAHTTISPTAGWIFHSTRPTQLLVQHPHLATRGQLAPLIQDRAWPSGGIQQPQRAAATAAGFFARSEAVPKCRDIHTAS